jgi:predicted TIM-barrel fold metal-dependent hydrolase
VIYDVMGEVSVCELLAEEYADVNFIIPHLGSFADDWRAQLALIDHLARHPNIYTDTSGARRFDLLEQVVHGWSRYTRRVNELPADQQAIVKTIGDAICNSHQPGCRPISEYRKCTH